MGTGIPLVRILREQEEIPRIVRPVAQGAGPRAKPFPEHLPRERVVVPPPISCTCCGSLLLSKVKQDLKACWMNRCVFVVCRNAELVPTEILRRPARGNGRYIVCVPVHRGGEMETD